MNMAFSSMVKDINRKIILESFWNFSRNTKQDITKKTELSFPTVSKLVDELNEQDIIHMLSDKRGETGGRKANEYILNQEYAYSLCLKVEREYIEVFIVDLYKQNISYDKIEEKAISAEKILKVIETKILNNKIKSIVVGIPGFIHDGIIGMADGIEALNGCNLKTEIFQKFNIETEVANNMNILVSGFQKELGDISCIHIGKNGPGSSYIVNGKPVSGAFGFQGEVGFNFYDEHRTFREIALEGYQNIDMIEYIGRLLLQIITVINPYKLYLYPLTDINIEELQNYCLRYVPQEAMPQIILKKTYDKDYQYSLLSRGIHLLQAII